jgi:predicted PurR-regulated permease PerM
VASAAQYGSSRCALAMSDTRFRNAFLLLLVTGISVAFVAMIREFLVTILLAAIFTGLSYPVYQWLLAGSGAAGALLLGPSG